MTEPIPPPVTEVINDEVLKGVLVDGFEVKINQYHCIFDGLIMPPRREKPIIVSRVIMPVEVLPKFIELLQKASEENKEKPKLVRTEVRK